MDGRHSCTLRKVACLLLVAGIGTTPLTRADGRLPGDVTINASAPARLLSSTHNYAGRFHGVGQLRAASSCTASLVAASDSPPANAPALILTAGHCVNYFDQNEVWVDRPGEAHWRFTPAFSMTPRPSTAPIRSSAFCMPR